MSDLSTSPSGSPWHSGERAIHEKMGNAAQLESIGRRVVRDFMPDQHRTFFNQLPFIVIATLAPGGQPIASLIEGPIGFLSSPTPHLLRVSSLPSQNDPIRMHLQLGAAVGMLGIELHTRRRNRLNGPIESFQDGGFSIRVQQSFGNCPKYIQLREISAICLENEACVTDLEHSFMLDSEASSLICASDTFFVASAHLGGEADHLLPTLDISHRGGLPGFVKVEDASTLCIPDFTGNFYFNTLGNFTSNPKGALLFLDFESGDMLQLTGEAEILSDSADLNNFKGAQRFWRFHITDVYRRRKELSLRYSLKEISLHLNSTGNWNK
jgi:predicted pyridoxine 5'-phosphate oxidase superfamily flavin-nucleotide-binding protein